MENGGNDFALLGDSVCPAACPGGAYHGRQAGKNRTGACLAAQLQMDNQNSIEQIDSAISDSRQATYDRTLYGYYDEFRKGSANFDTVYNKGQYYMAKQFGKRKEISSSVFMLLRAPKVYKMTNYKYSGRRKLREVKNILGKRLRRCSGICERSGYFHRALSV